MELIIGFIISYIANNIPTIRDLIDKDKSLEDELEKCYQKALKKWCKNDGIRKSMSYRMFNSISDLQKYLNRKDHINEGELVKLWAEELRNNDKCYHFILETKIDILSDGINEILAIIKQESKQTIKRGLIEHSQVKGYIRRYCTDEQDANDFLRYLLDNHERLTLADYVTGGVIADENKFILYSGAQTGKTTELKNLCWELQESGLYLPVSYEVKSSYDLKQDEMPRERWIEGKEVVVVIDALDETNGREREALLTTINSYAHDNPQMKMVLSCRSNYRRNDQLSAFHDLYIDSLNYEDVRLHINNELGERNVLWQLIVEQNLTEFAKQPFFLNVLIDAYRNQKALPKEKTGLYRLFVEKSYHQEKNEKATLTDYSESTDELMLLLERVAVAMSLMNKQTLNDNEFKKCLDDESKKIEECKRCKIIKHENETYFFEHNAFREWLTACYLYKEGLGKAKQLATLPNGRIKPEWYNIIMLWTSMYSKGETNKICENIDWLKLASIDLIVYSDREAIKKETREDIFISIMEEYKTLGIRMSNILTDDYKDLLSFGQTEKTVGYITEELEKAEPGTLFYADLMCMCYFLNWTLLENESKDMFNRLLNVLDNISIRNLMEKPTGDLQYLYLGNKFFYEKKYVSRYFDLFKASTNYDAIKVMISLINRSELVDDYVDYILEKEAFVQNQHEGNTTHVVSRDEIYIALSSARTEDNIIKILQHEFKHYLYYYDNEWKCYQNMMESLLQKSVRLIKNGGSDRLVKAIEESYLRTFPDQYHHTSEHQTLLEIYRNYYRGADCIGKIKDEFEQKTKAFFAGNEDKRKELEILYSKTGLWLTTEDIDRYYEHFDPHNEIDRAFAGWFNECPYLELSAYATEKYNSFFPEYESTIKNKERQQNQFKELEDYQVFQERVLELLDRTETNNSKDLRRTLKDDGERPWNNYPYQFYCHYTDRDGCYSRDEIVKAIKDKDVYDAFFMKMVGHVERMTMQSYLIGDECKKRQIKTAKKIVEGIGAGKTIDMEYKEIALQLMMDGHFTVDEDVLENLLPYSHVNTTKQSSKGFNETYTLFEYLEEHLGVAKLGSKLVGMLRDKERWKNSPELGKFADYIVWNRIENGYLVLFDYITGSCRFDEYIAEQMLKSGIMVDEIKAASDQMDTPDQLAIYAVVSRDLGDDGWVKSKLESRYQSFEGYHLVMALRILLSIGSLDALDYIVAHSEILSDEREFNFNYTDVNAANLLVRVLEICHINKYNHDYQNTSVINSLGNIAIQSEENLNEAKRVIRELMGKDQYFKYLNRYIIQFENKYYESHTPVRSIEQVIDMIDNDMPAEDQNENDMSKCPVYVSYNWERNSDHVVNHLCTVFDLRGIVYKRDKKDCHYMDNVKAFMNAIRNGEIIVVVLSRAYMLSKNCMFELCGILERKDGRDKILPVVVDDSIRDSRFYIDMVKHWKAQKEKKAEEVDELMGIDPAMVGPLKREKEEIDAIYGLLLEIKDYIDWVNAESLDNLSFTNFQALIDKIRERQG